MNVLSMIIQKKTLEAENFENHWRCKKTNTTHQTFADDLLLFCGASTSATSILKQALDTFSLLSGLEPNIAKSNIFFSGIQDSLKLDLLSIFGFPEGQLPVKYLGVPLISTRKGAAYHLSPLKYAGLLGQNFCSTKES